MDHRLFELHRALAAHAPTPAVRDPGTQEAAVALMVRPRADLELLMIKRAVHEKDPWSGHMALPGGRRDPADEDLLATAVREAREEIGISIMRDADYLGALDEVAPRTPRLPPILIAPFAFAVDANAVTTINSREVEAAVWVPIDALRDDEAAKEILIELEGTERSFPSFQYREFVIWGLTHRILSQFLEITAGL